MKYTAIDNETGEKINFEWHASEPPTDDDILQVQAEYRATKPQEGKSVGGFVRNVIADVPRTIKGMAQGVGELVKPMGSKEDPLATMFAGGISKLIPKSLEQYKNPGAAEAEASFDATKRGLVETYSKPLEYAYNRPISATMDLSTLLSGAGAAANLGGLSKTASVLSKAGKTIEPVSAGLRAIGATTKTVGKGASSTGKYISGLVTGKGKVVPEEAFAAAKAGGKHQQAYLSSLRGKVSEGELVEKFRATLQQIKDQRSAEYGQKLSDLEKTNFGLPPGATLDIAPVYNKLADIKKRFRLDKGISTLPPNEAKDFQQIMDMISEWDKNPYGKTPIGLDSLKQQLDNFYVPNKRIGAIATELKDVVRGELNKLPGYKEMTSQYEKYSKFIKEADKALSLNQRSAYDTTIRKIFQGMKEDKDFRRDLIKGMEKMTDEPLMAMAAGSTLNSWAPENLIGHSLAAGELMSIGYGVAKQDPTLALINAGLLGISSPRVTGELLNALGTSSRYLDKVKTPLLGASRMAMQPNMNQLMFQSGKFSDYYDKDERNK